MYVIVTFSHLNSIDLHMYMYNFINIEKNNINNANKTIFIAYRR